MALSPSLASLSVSWNHRLAQSATTLARGVRRHCSPSKKASIFFFAGSAFTEPCLAVRGVTTRFGDLGCVPFGLWDFAEDTTRDSSFSLATDSSDFPIKSHTHTHREGKRREGLLLQTWEMRFLVVGLEIFVSFYCYMDGVSTKEDKYQTCRMQVEIIGLEQERQHSAMLKSCVSFWLWGDHDIRAKGEGMILIRRKKKGNF